MSSLDDFPPAETTWGKREIIGVILLPTGPHQERVEVRTDPTDLDPDYVGRALITVGEMLLSGGEPGVTSTGFIIQQCQVKP